MRPFGKMVEPILQFRCIPRTWFPLNLCLKMPTVLLWAPPMLKNLGSPALARWSKSARTPARSCCRAWWKTFPSLAGLGSLSLTCMCLSATCSRLSQLWGPHGIYPPSTLGALMTLKLPNGSIYTKRCLVAIFRTHRCVFSWNQRTTTPFWGLVRCGIWKKGPFNLDLEHGHKLSLFRHALHPTPLRTGSHDCIWKESLLCLGSQSFRMSALQTSWRKNQNHLGSTSSQYAKIFIQPSRMLSWRSGQPCWSFQFETILIYVILPAKHHVTDILDWNMRLSQSYD